MIVLTLFIYLVQTYKTKDIEQIIGKNIGIESGYTLTLIHRSSFSKDPGQPVKSNDINQMNSLVSHLKQYKFRLTSNKSWDVKSYSVIITSNEVKASSFRTSGDIVRLSTLGDKYIFVKDKSGKYNTYEILDDNLDIEFFDDFFKSL